MRVVHFTDIHFQQDPKFGDLLHLKRLMGSTNYIYWAERVSSAWKRNALQSSKY